MRGFLRLIFALALLSFSTGCSSTGAVSPRAVRGDLDLSDWDFSRNGRLSLDGDWGFLWKQLETPPLLPTHFVSLPGYWSSSSNLPAQGWATYHLIVHLPQGTAARHRILALKVTEVLSAFRLWIEGIEVYRNGTVGTTEETSKPEYRPGVVFFAPQDDEMELTIQVSNFHYRKGGIWAAPVLGTAEQIEAEWYSSSQLNLFLVGGLLIMALYHFALWFLRRRDWSPLWFGLFCLVICSRVMLTGDQLLSQWWPGFNWELGRRLEFLPLCFGVIVFFLFIRSLFPECVDRRLFQLLFTVEGIATVAVVVLPVVFSNELVVPMQILILAALGWLFWIVAQALRRKLVGAWAIVFGSVVLLGTVVNDILYANQIVYTGFIMPLGFFLFVLMQALILSIKFTDSFRRSEQLTEELEAANTSFRRFVPREFLQHLSRENISQISLGDQVQREMTVMFTDIRSFTSLSEQLTPRETFNFLNSYLKRMGPVIREHGGFIDKFLGDGLLALFPDDVEAALDAAVSMYGILQEYNRHRGSAGYPALSIGIALNHGSLILGTIGEADRMDTSVVSDAVNVASRLEGLCKSYGPGILLPEPMLQLLFDPERFRYRRLDILKIRGRQEPIALVQVLDGQPPETTSRLEAFLPVWENAVAAYRKSHLTLALSLFREAQKLWPDDLATQMFVKRVESDLEGGAREGWSPIMDWARVTSG